MEEEDSLQIHIDDEEYEELAGVSNAKDSSSVDKKNVKNEARTTNKRFITQKNNGNKPSKYQKTLKSFSNFQSKSFNSYSMERSIPPLMSFKQLPIWSSNESISNEFSCQQKQQNSYGMPLQSGAQNNYKIPDLRSQTNSMFNNRINNRNQSKKSRLQGDERTFSFKGNTNNAFPMSTINNKKNLNIQNKCFLNKSSTIRSNDNSFKSGNHQKNCGFQNDALINKPTTITRNISSQFGKSNETTLNQFRDNLDHISFQNSKAIPLPKTAPSTESLKPRAIENVEMENEIQVKFPLCGIGRGRFTENYFGNLEDEIKNTTISQDMDEITNKNPVLVWVKNLPKTFTFLDFSKLVHTYGEVISLNKCSNHVYNVKYKNLESALSFQHKYNGSYIEGVEGTEPLSINLLQ